MLGVESQHLIYLKLNSSEKHHVNKVDSTTLIQSKHSFALLDFFKSRQDGFVLKLWVIYLFLWVKLLEISSLLFRRVAGLISLLSGLLSLWKKGILVLLIYECCICQQFKRPLFSMFHRRLGWLLKVWM
jgi:hypothetical protein